MTYVDIDQGIHTLELWVATKQQNFYWFFSIYCLLPINGEQKTTKPIFFIISPIFAILEDFYQNPTSLHAHMT